jgi:integrase
LEGGKMSRVFQRKGNWWIDYNDVQGNRHRKKIGPNKRVANEVLIDVLSKISRREHLGVVEESKVSFSEFTKTWKERIFSNLAPKTQRRWSDIVDSHLKPVFKGSLRGVTDEDVEKYMSKRLKIGVSPSTVNIEVTVLKHVFSRAVDWKYLIVNPIRKVKKFKEPPGRTRWLTAEEIKNLLAACTVESFQRKEGHYFSPLLQGYLKSFVLLSLNTGMRRGEVLSLTRQSIDWRNRIATLESTKNGEKRHVHLNDGALMAIKSLPSRLDIDRLFPFTGNQIGMALRRAIKRAGITDFRLHDLRHTFASHQAMNGVQARGLQELLGHKDGRMTTRYSHLSDAYLRDAVNGVVLGG